STLKRHGYYCRSRRAGSTTRSRSCIPCARRKARCDNRRPGCSRCIIKAVECCYPANTSKGAGPKIQHGDEGPVERRTMAPLLVPESPSTESRQEAGDACDIILDSTLVTSDPEFAGFGAEYFDWKNPELDFAEFLDLQTNDKRIQYPSSASSSLVSHSTPSTDPPEQQAHSSPNVSIPRSPTRMVRSFIQKPRLTTGAQNIANLILHTLKSYPLMMLRYNTLPPFIHPRLIYSDVENDHMEPLSNCISLVHMISSGVKGSRKLFWKNVRLECEHMCEEPAKLGDWGLLAAMQALSIYILIRMHEGETDHNNLDFLLATTVTVIAKHIALCHITCSMQYTRPDYGLYTPWKAWIFEESRRRLAVVFRVVAMLVYFEPAALCELQTDLILAPLPAKKQLWEAGDEYVWQAESERAPGAETAFGLAANGDLVKLDESQQSHCSDAALPYTSLDARHWEEWCSGMDGFGGLVMLAASLVV
ncbi:hypothetical protein LOCC1_G006780, partial [Lachnellula occidentalis]